MDRRTLYRLWAIKPQDIKNAIKRGLFKQGKVETKVTPDGLEQTLSFVPNKGIDFIMCEAAVVVRPEQGDVQTE
jgi:hypothetical protein